MFDIATAPPNELVDWIIQPDIDDRFSKIKTLFLHQYRHNRLYRNWVDSLHIDPATVSSVETLPFLPIRFFKTHTILIDGLEPKAIFESSGTTQANTSRHFVASTGLYNQMSLRAFELQYGPITDWCIIGLLPSYLERTNSSLVWMVSHFIKSAQHPCSGFYLNEYEALFNLLTQLQANRVKTIVIGVTFALIDFAKAYPANFSTIIFMETGGMKGRGPEPTRAELHQFLKQQWNLPQVHSEYGMTELLSQAYSPAHGVYAPPPWLQLVVRNEDDPLEQSPVGRGALNIIDFTNVYSCSFIATDDYGIVQADGHFEVLGRLDAASIRGCSQLV